MLLKKDYIIKSGTVLWTVAVGAYFFQFPFSGLSSLITPCLLLYVMLQLTNLRFLENKKYLYSLVIYYLLIFILICRSLFLGISASRVIRFGVILLVIPLTCIIRDNHFALKRDIFVALAIAKSIILIFFGLIIVYQGDFAHMRNWANHFDLGDIYFLNRFIPKVQVHGNALLVITFFLDYMSVKKITWKNFIILAGVLVAGNFAFMLALIAFVAWRGAIYALHFIHTNKHGKQITLAALAICLVVMIPYISSKVIETATLSNAVRIDQIMILLHANPIIGDGLGCWVSAATDYVTYEGNMYFEMQTLYIYKQIGIIALVLFYAITLMPIKSAGKKCFVIYLIYLFYSFWNPYCFDTTQMFTIILLINTTYLGEKNEKSAYHSLLSRRRCQKQHFRNS